MTTPYPPRTLDPRHLVFTPTGILHLLTGDVYKSTPALFSFASTTVSYDPQATAPQWLEYIEKTYSPADALVLQEYAGYLVSGEANRGVALCTWGDSYEAQRVYRRVLQDLMRNHWVHENFRHYFSGRKRPWPTNATILFPNGLGGISPKQEQVACRLVDNEPPTPGERVAGAKMVFSSYDYPEWRSLNDRLLLVEPGQAVESMHGVHLPTQIRENELPGVLSWAMEGYQRLFVQGGFTNNKKETTS